MDERAAIPQAVRFAVLRRVAENMGGCEDCGYDGPLEMHHLRYEIELTHATHDMGGEIYGRETEHDLVALCRDCHHGRHVDLNGEFWRDPEEMADHWWGYFNEMEKD